MPDENCLVPDRDIAFLLDHVVDLDRLLALPHFEAHSRETFDMYLAGTKRLARDLMFPAYKPMDEQPAVLHDGRILTHPMLKPIYDGMVELGVISATRPASVGGGDLPSTVATIASFYLMASNIAAACYAGLTTGAARLIESFGSDELKAKYMQAMYEGRWTGTMALTEPQAGSSLNDVTSVARPTKEGHHLLKGSKIFISGGDHDLTENIVHLALARIEGAPPGLKGVSLFVVPRLRSEGGELVDNDCTTAGAVHKIGWKGLASIVLNFGERDDCHAYLVGEPNCGIRYMFQMMNEARLLVGAAAVGTSSVAYQQSLIYAKERTQGRPLGVKDPTSRPIPIIEHADVRRMLLRQKAIVEGSMALVAKTAELADLAEHDTDDARREDARLLLDLLTPIAKTFPAEWGQQANALAIQIHGGYGYSSEYLPEAWWRDQKLNSLHEGTTQIQGLDLLGRKVVQKMGLSLRLYAAEVERTAERANRAGVDPQWASLVTNALQRTIEITTELGGKGMAGDAEGMLLHSNAYLESFAILTVGWRWLEMAAIAKEQLASEPGPTDETRAFLAGKLQAAQYWLRTELPQCEHHLALCRTGEPSFRDMKPEWY